MKNGNVDSFTRDHKSQTDYSGNHAYDNTTDYNHVDDINRLHVDIKNVYGGGDYKITGGMNTGYMAVHLLVLQ